MRFLLLLLFASCLCTCRRPPAAPGPVSTQPPPGTILTIILEVRPPSDSLHVFSVIRAPGRLRQDYPESTNPDLETGQLRFTFRSAGENILKETVHPFPGPNTYEVPSEEGTIEQVTLPAETRSFALRTQDHNGLRWLDISGTTNQGTPIRQRIDLKNKQ